MPADTTRTTIVEQPAAGAGAASPGVAGSLVSTVLALCFVLALAWLVLRGLKRLQAGRFGAAGSDVPRVLRSVSIGPRERLVTVRYRDREYLLGVAAGGVSLIDSTASAESVPGIRQES